MPPKKGKKYNKRTERSWNDSFVTPRVVIGIDQSYKRTGISIAIDGKLKHVGSIRVDKMESKTAKRRAIANRIVKYIEKLKTKYDTKDIIIILERIHVFTGGFNIRPVFIKNMGALIALIVDTAYDYDIPVFSVDTRSWKARTGGGNQIGEPVPGVKDHNKWNAIRTVIALGFEESLCMYGANGSRRPGYDDDAADSACIALYGFLPFEELKTMLVPEH